MRKINKFNELNLERAWSQEQLAKIAGLSIRTVQQIENEEKLGLEILSALTAVFEVSVTELTEADAHVNDALDQRISESKIKLTNESRFYRLVITAVIANLLLFTLNRFTSSNGQWPLWVSSIWFALLIVCGVRIFLTDEVITGWQKKRPQQMLRK